MTEIIIRDEIDIVKVVEAAQKLDLTKPQVATFKKLEDSQTEQQRKTYWMWLDQIVQQGGGTGNRYGLDEDFRKRFLKPTEYTRVNGETGTYIKSISKLNRKELLHLKDEVWVMAHEYGFTLRDPKEFNNAN